MEDADNVLVAGYRLDRYELLCPIASGGMASVWLARLRGKRGFEKLFAIKTIKTELISDSRFQQMFLDEARIASAIEHPNVAQILDLGEQGDILYTVMEWVDGESLAKIHHVAQKRGTPIPLGVSLRIMVNVLAGLQAAHDLRDSKGNPLGVVHRDVSPENILVTSSGAVKVIDFGVAKAKNRGAADSAAGVMKGKIRYMAPEQVKGEAVDHRADLWAVAICLYELVTGKDPFGDASDIDVLRRLSSEEPTPALQGLPESLVPIVPVFSRSLAAEPERRFESAAAMRRALLGAIEELHLASTSTSEEIADFLRTNMSDLEKKRRSQVARAVEAANAWSHGEGDGAAAAPSLAQDDVAFAETMVSDDVPVEPPRTPTTGGGATLTDQLAAPSRSAYKTYVAAAALLAVVGLVVWTSGGDPPAATDAAPSSAASLPPSPAVPIPAPLPAESSPSLPSRPAVASASASASASAGASSASASAARPPDLAPDSGAAADGLLRPKLEAGPGPAAAADAGLRTRETREEDAGSWYQPVDSGSSLDEVTPGGETSE